MIVSVINNPYAGINWLSATRVKAVSHEHVYNAATLAKMYDRGIRFFASVHYSPACPRYPFSSFSENYEDWNFFDIDVAGYNYSDVISARKLVPTTIGSVTTNYRQQGLILSYTDNNGKKYTKLTRDIATGETWDELCEDESAWVEVNDLDTSLTRHTKTLVGGFPTFQSKSSVSEWTGMSAVSFEGDGLEHNSDDFPRIPNAEHPCFGGMNAGHFNVLGTIKPDAGWSVNTDTSWRVAHPLYDIDDLDTVFPASSSFYDGKLFGTLNHSHRKDIFKKCQDICSWFKGYEIYNNGMQLSHNSSYRSCFHDILNDGRTIYCVAVTDWHNDFRGCSDVDGGTNVLYVPDNYNSMSVSDKSKAGMDCYCNGRFVASRFGSKYVTDFSVDEAAGTATFSVSDTAKDISLVFNGNYVTLHDESEITVNIPRGTTNITGEAWFGDTNGDVYKSDSKLSDDSDFLFTQAIIVETPKKKTDNEALIMFALE